MENRNTNTLSRDKVLSAFCLIVFVLLFIFACMKSSIVFGAKIVGTFGVTIYPVLILLSLVCLAKFLGLSYKRSIKATTFMILFIFSLLAVVHSIRTFSMLDEVSSSSTFYTYLEYSYDNLTVLGAFGCILCGAISYLIGAMGSIVVFVILATIFIGLFIDFELYGKYDQKHIKKLHSRKLQDKVIKSDNNISADGKPNYSFSNQSNKYSDEDVAAEITANFGEKNSDFEQQPQYTENDVVAEITDNQIYDDNQSYYSDTGSYGYSQTSDYSNNSYSQGYQDGYYDSSNYSNSSWQDNPFGSDATEKQKFNHFSNSGYTSQDYPNVYDENEERRKFLQATFNTDYVPESASQSENLNNYQLDYNNSNYEDKSYTSSFSDNFNNSVDFDIQSDNDGRLTQRDMEWKFNDEDFNYQYQFDESEDKKSNLNDTLTSDTSISNGFTSNNVDDKISEILSGTDRSVISAKEDFNNYNFTSSSLYDENFNTEENIKNDYENNFSSNNLDEKADFSFETKNSSFNTTLESPSTKKNIIVPTKQPEQKISSKSKMGFGSVKYNPPPLSLLNPIIVDNGNYDEEQERKANGLEITLKAFNLPVKVDNIVRGPKITRYELSVPLGVSIKKIPGYELDIKSALAAKTINIQAPIPGSKNVGIELENDTYTNVSQRELFESEAFKNSTEPLTVAIGKDISGKIVVGSLAKMVHLLVAGQTGSGKSVFIHSLIMSLIYKYSPDEFRLVLIDPKQVEFNKYNGLPHLITPEVVIGTEKAVSALKWCTTEMDRRYALMKMSGYNNIVPYNNSELVKAGQFEKLPYIVVIVDEFPEVILSNKKDAGDYIQRLTQLARACGIHLILVAQRPSVDVMSGVIKNNVPTRIAFSLSSSFDSKTILDTVGAENLLGGGDMLYKANGTSFIARLQGAYCSDEEIQKVIDYDKAHNEADYDEAVNAMINSESDVAENSGGVDGEIPPPKDLDPYFKTAIKIFMQNGSASASYLQRRLQVGYARAARIMDQLENRGYIGGASGSKTRKITITPEQYKQDFGEELDLDTNDSIDN